MEPWLCPRFKRGFFGSFYAFMCCSTIWTPRVCFVSNKCPHYVVIILVAHGMLPLTVIRASVHDSLAGYQSPRIFSRNLTFLTKWKNTTVREFKFFTQLKKAHLPCLLHKTHTIQTWCQLKKKNLTNTGWFFFPVTNLVEINLKFS